MAADDNPTVDHPVVSHDQWLQARSAANLVRRLETLGSPTRRPTCPDRRYLLTSSTWTVRLVRSAAGTCLDMAPSEVGIRQDRLFGCHTFPAEFRRCMHECIDLVCCSCSS
jgi:hypothetical protein